jgi:predicted RNA binding protein YcfA (HicA-like mRNA interferase family)
MKIRGVAKFVEDDGWVPVKAKESHRQCKHPTRQGRAASPDIRRVHLEGMREDGDPIPMPTTIAKEIAGLAGDEW